MKQKTNGAFFEVKSKVGWVTSLSGGSYVILEFALRAGHTICMTFVT